jgi:hypothetical protein
MKLLHAEFEDDFVDIGGLVHIHHMILTISNNRVAEEVLGWT